MTKLSEIEPVHKPNARNQLMSIVAYVAIALTILLLLSGIYTSLENKKATEKEIDQTTELIKEVKRLSEENKKLNQTSNNYAYCNAVLIAKYTQTLEPIQIEDLEKCILISFPEAGSSPDTSIDVTRQPISQAPTQEPSSPSQPNTPTTPSQPSETPSDERVTVNIPSLLGLPGTKLEPCVDLLALIKTC